MKASLFTLLIATIAHFNLFAQKPLHIESNSIILMFEKDLPKFIHVVTNKGFRKQSQRIYSTDVKGKEFIISYTFKRNVIKYYKSEDSNFLLSASIQDVDIFLKEIKFLSKKKSDIIPLDKRVGSIFYIESTGGLEELQVKYDKESIIYLLYKAHPD